jgi:UDP-glucose 4-epimerase
MRILVTGGAGFVGSHLVDYLVEQGHEVSVIDSLVHGGKKENVHRKAKLYKVDIRDRQAVNRVMRKVKPEGVFHLAAHINARTSFLKPILDHETNALATLNLAQVASEVGVQKFIYVSTGGVLYGDKAPVPTPETASTDSTIPYCISKLTGERYVQFIADHSAMEVVIFRPANIYGPRQNPHDGAGIISIFFEKMLADQPIIIFDDGEQTRDWIYVEDVVNALYMGLLYGKNKSVLHVATGTPTSVNTVFHELNNFFGNRFEKTHHPAIPGEQKNSCLSIEKIQSELKWAPKIDMETGLKKTALWYLEEQNKKKNFFLELFPKRHRWTGIFNTFIL